MHWVRIIFVITGQGPGKWVQAQALETKHVMALCSTSRQPLMIFLFFFSHFFFFCRDLLLLSDILMSQRHSKVLHPNHPWNEPGGLLEERKVGQQDVKTKHARRMNGMPQKSEQVWHIAAALWRSSTPPQHTSTTTHVDQRLTCFSAPRLRERRTILTCFWKNIGHARKRNSLKNNNKKWANWTRNLWDTKPKSCCWLVFTCRRAVNLIC